MSQTSTLLTSAIAPRRPLVARAATSHDSELCVSCGACLAHCGVAALAVDSDYRVTFSASVCRGCALCIPACAYGALALTIPAEEQ